MKLANIQFGQAIRLFQVHGLSGTLYGPNLTRAFESKYGFLEGPRTVPQYDSTKGIVFQHGLFEGVVIDKLTIFNDGLVCETKVDTDIADRFFDNALEWAQTEAGWKITDDRVAKAGRMYTSRVDVQADIGLDHAIKGFSEIGAAISEAVKRYGVDTPSNFLPASIDLHYDFPASQRAVTPFSFARLVGQPWSERRYLSSAPLRTTDHLRILELLEKSLAD